MLKKRLGTEAIEGEGLWGCSEINLYYKIPPTLIIPDGCKEIGNFTFWKCMRLREVVIPKSLKVIGDKAFYKCASLKRVVIPESVEEIKDQAFYGCEKAEIIVKKPESKFKFVGLVSFYRCKSVEYAEEKTRN